MKKKSNSLCKYIAALNRKHDSYQEYLNKVEALVAEKTAFKCSIVYQSGDGFCLLNEDDGILLAPLGECESIIFRAGLLSEKDHKNICI
jgi:hypothetical protein